jgi:hypothetical protein
VPLVKHGWNWKISESEMSQAHIQKLTSYVCGNLKTVVS